ncbi:transposase [Bradyrhizobium sp. CIR3A]|uniref:transposase n=1 Tax=Bradyrhizobium sp. CIR3A TaxID=2663838 RepID=UPI001830FCDB|nr:transposase [Bradyrhizobium sp. CIR3A]MBB4259964.1 hypothetical protein [Bradyrhizobium sp. CIR3A]
MDRQVEAIERELAEIQQVNPMAKLLSSIPGIGPITATALAATVPDATMFRSGREFAAWLGLTPKQNSTGGKDRLGRLTKQGDSYLRHLLVIGARNVVWYPKARSRVGGGWIEALLERRLGLYSEARIRGRQRAISECHLRCCSTLTAITIPTICPMPSTKSPSAIQLANKKSTYLVRLWFRSGEMAPDKLLTYLIAGRISRPMISVA